MSSQGPEQGKLRLMAVHAHPDDESSKGAATMARYVREGSDVLVCTMTGGERGDEWRELEITTKVPCGDYFETRDQALKAHATQVDPNGFWFSCPLDVQRSAWPTEDYHLARSVVDSELPEDDLFAGVRETLPVSAAGTPGRAR